MKISEASWKAFCISYVQKRYQLSITTIKEWNHIAIPCPNGVNQTFGVTLRLFKGIYRCYGDLFCFEDAYKLALHEQGIISGTIFRRVLFDRMVFQKRSVEAQMIRRNRPVKLLESGIYSFLAGNFLRFK